MAQENVYSPESQADLGTFEEPYSKRSIAELAVAHTFTSATGNEAHVIMATTPDTVENETSQKPVYFHGGYGVDNAKYLRYLAERHGRFAFTVVYGDKRKRDQTYWQEDPVTNEWQLVPRAYVRQHLAQLTGAVVAKGQVEMADDIFTAMDYLGIEKADAIGQSVGALRTVVAAYEEPERIGTIVLPYPAGVAKPSRRQMLPNGMRYARAWRRQRMQGADKTWQPFLDQRTAPFQKPVADIGADGDNVLLSYHAPLLHAMRQQKHAPGVAIVTGEHDHIFPTHRILESLQDSEDLDYLFVAPGLHAIGNRRQIMDQTVRLLDMAESRTSAGASCRKPLVERVLSHASVAPAYVESLRKEVEGLE